MKKNIKLLAMLIIVVGFITTFESCSNEKDDEDLIVGIWKCTQGASWDDTNFNPPAHPSYKTGETIEFKKNGTTDKNLTWTISDKTLIIAGGLRQFHIHKLTKESLIISLVSASRSTSSNKAVFVKQ